VVIILKVFIASFLARGVRIYTVTGYARGVTEFDSVRRPRTSGACAAGGEVGMAQHRGDSEAAPGCPLTVDGVRPGCYAAAESESESKGLVRVLTIKGPVTAPFDLLMFDDGYYNIFS
jgi:hypothetical protein